MIATSRLPFELRGATSWRAIAAHTGFVEGIILYALTSVGVVGAIGPTLTNILVPALASLAVSAAVAGLNYLLMPKPPTPETEGGKVPITQAVPPRIFAIGTDRIAGSRMLWEEKRGYLYAVHALCGHKAHAINGFYLQDDFVVPDEDGYVPEGEDGRYQNDNIWIDYRLGEVPETPYGRFVDALSEDGVWTADHRGDGQASLAIEAGAVGSERYQETFPYGAPQASALLDGAELWDFRDPEQDPLAPSTWTFSKNPVLAMAWWQCFCPFGPKLDYTRVIVPVLDIWRGEADICDEQVERAAGGTENRYEVNGWGTTETDPVAVENAIMASCDGWRVWRGDGALIFRVGKFREELVATITDADLVGHTVSSDVPEEDEVNRLVPKFTYPATDYTTSDTDFFEDLGAQLRVGRVLSQEANFGWVQQWRQVRRLGKRTFARMREKVRGILHLRLSAFNAVYSPWVRLETPVELPRLNGAIIENRRAALALTKGGFQMEFNRLPADIEAWNPATDEGAAPPIPLKPARSGLPAPVIDTATAVSSSGTVYLRVVLIDFARTDLTPIVSYRVKDTGEGEPGSWVDQAFEDWEAEGGLVALDTNPVPNDQLLEVSAYLRARSRGPRSAIVEVQSTVNTVAPLALSDFAVTAAPDGVHFGAVQLNFVTQSDVNLSRIALYRVPAGVALDKDVHDRIVLAAAPGTSFSYVDGDATRDNELGNPGCATDTVYSKGTGWTHDAGDGEYDKVAGTASNLSQSVAALSGSTATWRYFVDMPALAAGTFGARLIGGTAVDAPTFSSAGRHFGEITANGGNTHFALRAWASASAGSVTYMALVEKTPACAPAGEWDYYPFPENVSGIEGPGADPVLGVVIA